MHPSARPSPKLPDRPEHGAIALLAINRDMNKSVGADEIISCREGRQLAVHRMICDFLPGVLDFHRDVTVRDELRLLPCRLERAPHRLGGDRKSYVTHAQVP
jgi:hypothetical protein